MRIGNNNQQQGLGMIEILIALFVVSFGSLAAAAMQMGSMSITQESLFKTQAVRIAQSITEDMRANPEGVALGLYSDVDTAVVISAPDCFATGCSVEQIAQIDIARWANSIVPTDGSPLVFRSGNEGSEARATVQSSIPDLHTITVSWQTPTINGVFDSTHTIVVRL